MSRWHEEIFIFFREGDGVTEETFLTTLRLGEEDPTITAATALRVCIRWRGMV